MLPKHLRDLKKEKQELIKHFKRTRNSNVKIKINQLCRLIKGEVRKWEEDKQIELLEELNDPETRWQSLRKLDVKETKMTTLYKPDNEPVYTNKGKADLIADTLKDRFQELEVNCDNEEAQGFTPPPASTDYPVPTITSAQVEDAIQAAKVKSAPGHDGISYKALKSLSPSGINYLTQLFNAILKHQYYPEAWKKAIIIPIPKPGKDPHMPGNYRPISLTPCIYKIFKKFLLNHTILVVRN